jgi:signal transduction histidine kinase
LSEAGAERRRMEIHLPAERAEQVKRLSRLIGREPFQKRTWAELGFFLVSSALACVVVLALAALGFVGLVLTFMLVGVLVLAGGLRAARGLGGWQRGLARRMLGEEISDPEPFTARPGLLGWLRASFADWAAWRTVGYFIAKVPLTVFGVWFALSVWVEALSGIASPLIGGDAPARFGLFARFLGPGYDSESSPGFSTHVAVFVTGVVLLFIAPWAMRLVVFLDRRMMHLLLSRDAGSSRVKSLEEARSRTLDVAAETLRRIERNLHDGTQAQLVALAMRLGMAKEKLADDDVDLARVRQLVEEAHRGAKEAITELRDIARGIHPPALDIGLEGALATLAARSAVPTALSVELGTRPTPAIEAIAYFCVAELLANVAQHARASRASVSCTQQGTWLRLVVRDDGTGGAQLTTVGSSSSGLAGLTDRVHAVDGRLHLVSPPGGPTVVTVDLPLAS